MKRVALAVLAAALAIPLTARAHGRQPSLGQVAFDPVDATHLVVRGTWAFLTTRNEASSFTWTCARAIGSDREIEDPRIVVLASGRVLAGTFRGLARSDPTGCSYALVTDPALNGLLVIDIANDPFDPRAAWIATSPGDHPNTILRSSDEGATFELRGTFASGVLLERVVPSPSDAMRVYASGVALATATEPRHAYVWHSTDGAHTFTPAEISLVDVMRTDYGERNVHVDAVDPTNPDVVFAHTIRRPTDMMDERLFRSADGGQTFTVVASMPEITGVVVSEDGVHVWAGSWYGGFVRSDDNGRTFQTLDATLRVRCLAYRVGELWVCTDDVTGPFALGRSSDLGVTIDPLWTFRDAVNDVGCSACTQAGEVCPGYWPDVELDLGLPTAGDALPADPDASASCLDAGPMDGGSTPAPRPNCGCSTRAPTERPIGLALVCAGLAILLHRRSAI